MARRVVIRDMVEDHWAELAGKELRYSDDTWELTGDVEVRRTGEVLNVAARQVDDVRHRRANLRFVVEGSSGSPNPGNLGDHFDRLEQDRDGYRLLVKKEPRTYRYELRGVEYD